MRVISHNGPGARRRFREGGIDIDSLADNPSRPGVERLAGSQFYRLRVGEYRIVFDIQDEALLVIDLKVGHGREIYGKKMR